jgi:beta-glucuronidase
MKWLGANSFRTSHYPYSEECSVSAMRRHSSNAETPAVGLNSKSYKNTYETHRQVISDMISRDKNHPSIVMWSLANEPNTEDDEAYGYFMPLYEHAHSLDPQGRPVTVVACNNNYVKDKAASAMDVICVNSITAGTSSPAILTLRSRQRGRSWNILPLSASR